MYFIQVIQSPMELRLTKNPENIYVNDKTTFITVWFKAT